MTKARMPGVLLAVMLIAVFFVLGNALEFIAATNLLGKRPIRELLGTLVVTLTVTAASGLLLYALDKRKIRSRAPVSLYLLAMLVIYPIGNVLKAHGLYLAGAELADPSHRAGTAAYELARYAVLLGLIFWVSSSKSLKKYLASDGQALV